jgi:hypothetical protein
VSLTLNCRGIVDHLESFIRISDDGKIRKVEIQTVREINLVHMSRPVIELVLLVPVDSN